MLAIALGVACGVARLSQVWVVSRMARGYLEVMRNTPLLLQLLFWYSLSQLLPVARGDQPLPVSFSASAGCSFQNLSWHAGFPWIAVERPLLVGFGFEGGTSISPEFAALLVGLTTYTAAFIGEIVRGGILAVDKGQSEAAAALGLSRATTCGASFCRRPCCGNHPTTTSAVPEPDEELVARRRHRLPDLISITNTTLNQTGQAIEAIALAMAVYLAISLACLCR